MGDAHVRRHCTCSRSSCLTLRAHAIAASAQDPRRPRAHERSRRTRPGRRRAPPLTRSGCRAAVDAARRVRADPRRVAAARRAATDGCARRVGLAAAPTLAAGRSGCCWLDLIVGWAGRRPGYDPYGWLVWGHLTVHGTLDTNGAPSWKPLPYLFTLPYALAGQHALWLWMITAVAVSLSGVVFAWRVAFRLVDAPPERRYAAYAGRPGRRAGGARHRPVPALDPQRRVRHDDRRPLPGGGRLHPVPALPVGVLGCGGWRALGRPEVWAPMAVYVVWAWRTIPAMRRQMVARPGADPAAVVRDPGAQLQEPVLGRPRWPRTRRASCTATRSPGRSAASSASTPPRSRSPP